MLRAVAVRSARRACTPLARQLSPQQHSRQLSQTHARSTRQQHANASPLVSQAILLDRFGKQQQYNYSHQRAIPAQSIAYWKTALVASGVCIASSLSDDSAARAASSKGSGDDKSASDLFEELKRKLQELSSESLEALQKHVPDEYKDIQTHVNDFLASGKGGQISWGFAMGVCSGFALKKVSKVGALALGSLFVLLQCASYSGYIDVDYKKLERDVMSFLDINKDGQFDAKDIDAVYKQVMKVLEFSLPAGSGYAVGFLVGFRAG